jgi:threonine dehydratase
MPDSYVDRILKARVYDIAVETPLTLAPRLSARLGNTVLLKREDLQPVFSFKLRGAYNKLIHLDSESRARGVIAERRQSCASALGASRLGLQAMS